MCAHDNVKVLVSETSLHGSGSVASSEWVFRKVVEALLPCTNEEHVDSLWSVSVSREHIRLKLLFSLSKLCDLLRCSIIEVISIAFSAWNAKPPSPISEFLWPKII